MTMTIGLAVLCGICWFIGTLYGLYLAERRGKNRSIRKIVTDNVGGDRE